MITLENLTYRYRKGMRPALDNVSACIPAGINLLAGENGAGKTTLLHILASLLTPTSGSCLIDGQEVSPKNTVLLARCFLLEENMCFPASDIRKFARIHSPFYPTFSQEAFEANLDAFGLTGNESFKRMSLGNRKKAQLAYVLALGTDYLLLDEPTNALDIQSKDALCKMIARSVEPDQTLIVSTHTIGELENMFDGITLISMGRCLLSASADEIASRLAFDTLRQPADDALYQERLMGCFRAIFPATDGDLPTRPDFRLLYNAMYSSARDQITNAINNDNRR